MSFIDLKYSSVLESENKMYNDVKAFLVEQKVNSKLINHIMLSISESFTNALVHGNKFDSNKYIHISLTTNNIEITADIIDEGSGDINQLGSSKNVDPWQEGGRGMMLIEKMTSHVEIAKSEETGGIRVSMRFDANKYDTKVEEKV